MGPDRMIRALLTSLLALSACADPASAWGSPFTITRVDSMIVGTITPGRLVATSSGAMVATDGVLGNSPACAVWGTPYTARMFVSTSTGWVRHTSEPPIDISMNHALVMDHSDRMHVLSWQNPVSDSSRPVLQEEDGAGWATTVLDTSAVTALGLAIDSQDRLWAAYLRVRRFNCCWGAPYELVVCHRTELGWTRDSLVVPMAPGNYTPYPFAVDGDGQPHVLFAGSGYHGLYHAVRTDAGWQISTVDTSQLLFQPQTEYSPAPQLAVASDGTAHAIYRVGPELRYARLAAGEWTKTTFGAPPAQGSVAQSLALDQAGRARVAYLAGPDYVSSFYSRIVYAYQTDGFWNYVSAVDDPPVSYATYDLTLVLGENDTPAIYFHGPYARQLSVATLAPTAAVGPTSPPARIGLSLVSSNPTSGHEPMRWSVASPREATITLEAFDLAGRRVAASAPFSMPAGQAVVPWAPDGIGPGAYFVRAREGGDQSRGVLLFVSR